MSNAPEERMNRAIARIASDNMLRQLLFGVIGFALLATASDPWLRVLGGLLVGMALVLAGVELVARSQAARRRTQ